MSYRVRMLIKALFGEDLENKKNRKEGKQNGSS